LLGFVGVRDVVALTAALSIPLTTTSRRPGVTGDYCRVGG